MTINFDTIHKNATTHVTIASQLRDTMEQLVIELEKNASVTRWFRRRVTHNKTIDRLLDDLTEKKTNAQKALEELNAQEDNEPIAEDELFKLSKERQELEENYEAVIEFLNEGASQIEDGEDPTDIYELNYGSNADYISDLKSFVNQPRLESLDKQHQINTFTDTTNELNALLARMRQEDEQSRQDYLKRLKRAQNANKGQRKVSQDNLSPDELQATIDRLTVLIRDLETPREALFNTSGANAIDAGQVEAWQGFIARFNQIASDNGSGANFEPLESAGDPMAIETLYGDLKGIIEQIRGLYPMKTYADLMNTVTKIAHDISAQRGARAFNNRIEEVTESANTGSEIFNTTYWQIKGIRHQNIRHRTTGDKQVHATHSPIKSI